MFLFFLSFYQPLQQPTATERQPPAASFIEAPASGSYVQRISFGRRWLRHQWTPRGSDGLGCPLAGRKEGATYCGEEVRSRTSVSSNRMRCLCSHSLTHFIKERFHYPPNTGLVTRTWKISEGTKIFHSVIELLRRFSSPLLKNAKFSDIFSDSFLSANALNWQAWSGLESKWDFHFLFHELLIEL